MSLKLSRNLSSCFYRILLALFFALAVPAFCQQPLVPLYSADQVAKPASGTPRSDQFVSAVAPQDKGNQTQSQESPSVSGAKTIILKEGEKVPERKNPDYEDWSKPELTPGMRMEVVPLGKSEWNGVVRELVSVQWREMDPINLWIIKPTGVSKPPVVLYLYSYPSTNDRYKDPEFCKFLAGNGYAAVGFVSAITGERFHDRARRDWFVNQLQEAMGTSVHDVQMILNYLETRADLDMTRIGMWGDGSGASIAIMAAAVDSRIKALDLLDPWGDWPDWLAKSELIPEEQRPEYLTPRFLGAMDNLDPLKWLPQLKTPQIRLQYIEEGLTVTPDAARQKMEAATPAQTKMVHYKDKQAFVTEVGSKGIGFDWIKSQLRSVPETSDSRNQYGARTLSEPTNKVSGSNR